MALHAIVPRDRKTDLLATALLAAELGEPFRYDQLSTSAIQELFESIGGLRASVPFATLGLLAHLALDERAEVRARVARALPFLADRYPERVERLLIPLACDVTRPVRAAAAQALAALIEASTAPRSLIERWERLPERARDVLSNAFKRLPPFYRT
jgi:hypothetical protein